MDQTTTARRPPLDVVAGFVKLQRAILRWKQSALAGMAGVSLSTVQRVERGEPVDAQSLDKIGKGLGLEPGALTAPRVKRTESEVAASLAESLGWMHDCLPVQVAPFRSEPQLRALASADMAIMDTDVEGSAPEDMAELREWLDLAGFVRLTIDGAIQPRPERSFRVRMLYRDILDHVAEMEKRHAAVCLVGTYVAETDSPDMPTATVGMLVLRSKRRNPAAAKIDTLWAEKVVSWRAAMEQGG